MIKTSRAVPVGLAGVLAVLTIGIAPAAPAVDITGVTITGSSATVVGTATFTPIVNPQSVGGRDTNFGVPEIGDTAGIDLVDAKIVPLANGSGLRFIWVLKSLPPQIPPEGVRYTWSFRIGATQYQLQAKRTNLASATTVEDPVNHVLQVQQGSFFQLRGACTSAYLGTPVSGCYHLAFLFGSFDVANSQVSIDLLYNTKDQIGRLVAPDFVPGAVVEENISAGMSITAAFQAVIGNTSTSDYINGWNPYFAGATVQLGVGPASADPKSITYPTRATLSGTSFSGTVSGLGGTNNTVFARACNGTDCAFDSIATS